jgi:hypothetical protein
MIIRIGLGEIGIGSNRIIVSLNNYEIPSLTTSLLSPTHLHGYKKIKLTCVF